MKGQVGMEFLMITALALILIIPLVAIFFTEAQYLSQDVTAAQVNKLAEELVNAVDDVYYLGEPTRKTFSIYIPEYVDEAYIGTIPGRPNAISILVDTGDNQYAVTKFSVTNVTGSLNTYPGTHSIQVTAVGNEVIVVG